MWTFASNFWNTITENWLPSREPKLVAELTLCLVIGIWSLPLWAPIMKLDITDLQISTLRAVVTPWLILVAIVVIQYLATRAKKSSTNLLPWKFHKTITLSIGAYHDVLTKNGDKFFRITLKDISQQDMPPPYDSNPVPDEIKTEVATIGFDPGFFIYPGSRVKKVVTSSFSNEECFYMCKNEAQEVSYSVFFFNTEHVTDGEHFFRCFVDHINPVKKEVDINIFFIWLKKGTTIASSRQGMTIG